jgi:hypothetical protein
MACDTYIDDGGGDVMWLMEGIASFFCCGSAYSPYCGAAGSGACGTCNSNSIQCAWPNLAFHGTNYAAGCRPDLPQFFCGDTFYVVSHCPGYSGAFPTIADHGPNTAIFCHNSSPCFSDCGDRIIDLTPACFAMIASLDAGLTSVQVRWSPI